MTERVQCQNTWRPVQLRELNRVEKILVPIVSRVSQIAGVVGEFGYYHRFIHLAEMGGRLEVLCDRYLSPGDYEGDERTGFLKWLP